MARNRRKNRRRVRASAVRRPVHAAAECGRGVRRSRWRWRGRRSDRGALQESHARPGAITTTRWWILTMSISDTATRRSPRHFPREIRRLRGLVVLIIHGAGPDAWRSDNPKAKYVIVNLPYGTFPCGRFELKKKTIEALYVEEAGEMAQARPCSSTRKNSATCPWAETCSNPHRSCCKCQSPKPCREHQPPAQ